MICMMNGPLTCCKSHLPHAVIVVGDHGLAGIHLGGLAGNDMYDI